MYRSVKATIILDVGSLKVEFEFVNEYYSIIRTDEGNNNIVLRPSQTHEHAVRQFKSFQTQGSLQYKKIYQSTFSYYKVKKL